MPDPATLRLDEVFAVLTPALAVDTVEVNPDLYTQLDERYAGFGGHVLVALHEFTQPWGSWERHPAGDEIVVLLSGHADFRIRAGAGERCVTLAAPGEYVVVPQGQWHTAETNVATKLLFVTPGEGTEHAQSP